MSNEKHTPGPWLFVYHDKFDEGEFGVFQKETESSICSLDTHFSKAEQQANAELIASAPALLSENKELKERNQQLEQALRAIDSKIEAIGESEDYDSGQVLIDIQKLADKGLRK